MNDMETTGSMRSPISARQCFSRIGFAYFVLTALTTVLQVGATILLQVLAPDAIFDGWAVWVVSFVPMYAIAVPVCIALMQRIPHEAPEHNPLGAKRFFRFFLMCIGIMYLGNMIGMIIMQAVGMIKGQSVDNAVATLIQNSSVWINVLVTVLLAPIIEELLFRKLLIDRTRQFGEGLSILLSGLLFGLFHGNLYQFFYAFGLGAIFAYIYIRTGRLRYSITLHMLINLMGAVIAPAITESIPQVDLTSLESIQPILPQMALISMYSMAVIIGAVAGIILIFINYRKRTVLPGVCPLPRGTRFKTVVGNAGMILFLLSLFALFVFSIL